MRIEDLEARDVKVCMPSDTLELAARKMWDADVGCIPIVDDDRRVVGIITDRDVCMGAYTKRRRLDEISVGEVMSRVVYTCHPGDSVAHVEQIMREKQVRRIPVVEDDGRLVGIVSLNDLARHVESSHRGQSELTSTLAAICQPRVSRARPTPSA